MRDYRIDFENECIVRREWAIRAEAAEADRDQLMSALREIARIVGGNITPAASVDFHMGVVEEVWLWKDVIEKDRDRWKALAVELRECMEDEAGRGEESSLRLRRIEAWIRRIENEQEAGE